MKNCYSLNSAESVPADALVIALVISSRANILHFFLCCRS
jgi:hypothetical protein